MHDPTIRVCQVAEIRAIEEQAFATQESFAVMEKAAAAVARACVDLADPLLLVAGRGNNGGDAMVAGTLLRMARRQVAVWQPLGAAGSGGDAERAARLYASVQGRIESAEPDWHTIGAVVDGLFGIGLARDLEGLAAQVVTKINATQLSVVAIDVPSGLCADHGTVRGAAIKALRTITFFSHKPGLLMRAGKDYAGLVTVADLGHADLVAGHGGEVVGGPIGLEPLRRTADSHKGSYGILAVAGGAEGMTGALYLATRSAVAHGAGKVFAVPLDDNNPGLDLGCPEVMWRQTLPPSVTGIVFGVGAGTGPTAQAMFKQIVNCNVPCVIDADGLNLLAANQDLGKELVACPQPRILTPHPTEAARLLGVTTQDVQADRVGHAQHLARNLASVVVLKGSGTVIADPSGRWGIVDAGNPGLAQAGSGDVLAGVIGALLVQGMDVWDAAATGAWLHATAADQVLKQVGGPLGLPLQDICVTSARLLAGLLPS